MTTKACDNISYKQSLQTTNSYTATFFSEQLTILSITCFKKVMYKKIITYLNTTTN